MPPIGAASSSAGIAHAHATSQRYAVRRDIAGINRSVFQRRGVLRQYATASGWLDAGEPTAVRFVSDHVRDAPILDIGVGAGRTVPLLTQISADYCGIDFSPPMVEHARRRFPDQCFRVMDARRLDLPAGHYGLAVFSYNGIDCVDPAGRQEILGEVHRVLRPGGYFVFSTLNRHGAEWRARWPDWRVYHGAGRHPLRLLRATAKLLVGGANRLVGLLVRRDFGELGIASLSAHNFAPVVMFATLAENRRQLQAAGFVLTAVFDPDGRALDPLDSGPCAASWFYIVARSTPLADGEHQA